MMDASKRPKGCNRKLKDCDGGFGYWMWENGRLHGNGELMVLRTIEYRCGGDTDDRSVRLCRDCLIKEGYLW